MPDRSKVMTQTKRDTLVLQVGVLAWGYEPHTLKNLLLRKWNKGKSWIDLKMMEVFGDR
jgi:lambda repressor-like predicted transcriptional regulator